MRVQQQRQDIIQDLSAMVREHLMMFYKSTGGYKPHRIIMYRDGVSEGQFTHVLQHELTALREACIKVRTDSNEFQDLLYLLASALIGISLIV